MHDIKLIRDNPQAFDAARARRGLEPVAERLLALDDARKAAISALQRAQERRNAASKEIGVALKEKDQAKAEALKAEVAKIKEDWPQLEAAEREAIKTLEEALAELPNTPLESVPDGKDEHDNVEALRWGEPRQIRLHAERAFRPRRGPGAHGFRGGGEALGRALRRQQGQACAARARARAIHARSAHGSARLYGSRAAAARARRGDVRHGATAEVPRGPILCDGRPASRRREPQRKRLQITGSSRPPKCR